MTVRPSALPPRVWYVAAGYLRAGGVEAYLCHYTTEMRERGFDTRIVVFESLPVQSHRFLDALRERGIPIVSLYDRVGWTAKVAAAAVFLPWAVWRKVRGQEAGGRGQGTGKGGMVDGSWLMESVKEAGDRAKSEIRNPNVESGGQGNRLSINHQPSTINHSFPFLLAWWMKRLAVRRLARMIRRERPDIVHVKGRLVAEAWTVFPPEKTIYHIATYGGRDPSWTDADAVAFRSFASGCARVIAPGTLVAETFKREFGVERQVDVVFTMAPDEAGGRGQGAGEGRQKSECRMTNDERSDGRRPIRFGIFCRLAEEKGILGILAAMELLGKRGIHPAFTFVGEGPMEERITAWIAGRDAGDTVRVRRASTAGEALAEMDVFVHPSRNEAMPVSVVEALMYGRPCIATPVGGIPDLIRDEVEGMIVPVGDSEALANAMERFVSIDGNELDSFRRRARRRYEEMCRPDVVCERIAGTYADVLESACGVPEHTGS